MNTITLNLTIDETNTILAALGEQPYVKVADTIQKIQREGASQMKSSNAAQDLVEKQKESKNGIPVKNGK